MSNHLIATGRVLRSTGTDQGSESLHGFYGAVVTANNDPEGKSRIKMLIPQVFGTAVSNWAEPIAMLPADLGGIVPAVGTVVHAVFTGGDRNRPAWAAMTQAKTAPQPVTWTALTLLASWTNVSGAAAAQYRPSGSDGVEIIGNIQSGTVTNGTTIAVLPSGSRPVSSHSFNIAAVTGAQAAPITVTTTTTTTSSLSGSGAVHNNTIEASPPAGAQGSYGSLTLANLNDLASYANALGTSVVNNSLFLANTAVDVIGTVDSFSSSSSSATANFNSPLITVDTSGNLKISNVNSHVTAISFHHTISLTA